MDRVFLTRWATRHFDQSPARLQEPVLNALTELEIDLAAAGKQLLGRLKGLLLARLGSFASSIRSRGEAVHKMIVRAIKHRGAAYQPRK